MEIYDRLSNLHKLYNSKTYPFLSNLYKKFLVEDVANENINYVETKKKIDLFFQNMDQEQIAILKSDRIILKDLITEFNVLCYLQSCEIVDDFLYEMNYRIQKMLIILLLFEKHNLISFGGKPELSDIPTFIVKLHTFITDFVKKNKSKCIEKYNKMLDQDKNFYGNYLK